MVTSTLNSIGVITAQQHQNLLTARAFFSKRDAKEVALNKWRGDIENNDFSKQPNCGSPACFGGWCPFIPEFAAQGVEVEPSSSLEIPSPYVGADPGPGRPYIRKNRKNIVGYAVSFHLFGWNLFEPRERFDPVLKTEVTQLTDVEIVLNRIELALRNSRVV